MKTLFAAVALLALARPAAAAMDKDQQVALLKAVDTRQNEQGDYRSQVYMEQKQKDKVDTVYNAEIYRRGADKKLIIMYTAPKTEAGKGYLRIEDNLWFYDPTVGKWERRTERERIGGTNARRSDFDDSRLAQEYDPEFVADEKLGAYSVHHLKLTAKPDIDVAFSIIQLWIDAATNNILKRQEFALSGRLMRTSYYPKWQKLYSESKKADLWYPQEIRFYDEVEKANQTLILIKSVDLRPLDQNLFTKSWLESKSR